TFALTTWALALALAALALTAAAEALHQARHAADGARDRADLAGEARLRCGSDRTRHQLLLRDGRGRVGRRGGREVVRIDDRRVRHRWCSERSSVRSSVGSTGTGHA